MMGRFVACCVTGVVLLGCGGGTTQEAARPSASASAKPSASVASAPVPVGSASASAAPEAPPPPVTVKEAVGNLIVANVSGFKAHDSKKIEDLYARDAVIANPGPNGLEDTTPRAMARDLDALFAAFPDAQFSPVRVLAKGNVALLEWALTGTNRGEFMGHPATNKSIGYRGLSILLFTDAGLVKHETMYFDMPTVLGQLGLGAKGAKSRPAMTPPSAPPEMVFIDGARADTDDAPLLKDFFRANDQHDDKALQALLADDVVVSTAYMPQDQKKAELVKEVKDGAKAFPDAKTQPVACWTFGPWLACESVWTATFKGPAMGMKPTNKSGLVHSVELVRVGDGKIVAAEAFANGSEFAASFGLGADKPKSGNDQVTLTGSKPATKPSKPAPSKP